MVDRLSILIYLFTVHACYCRNINGKKPQLLIVSFDGFRHDYYEKNKAYLDSLTDIASQGVRAGQGLKSVFSTETFPVHWSIATGLYEESHGLIGNEFFDPLLNETFTKASSERKWFGGEPLWVTAVKQGLKVGVFMWIGSFSDFTPYNPTDRIPVYDNSVPLSTRFDQVFEWLTGEPKMDLVMCYYEEPDSSGHRCGTNQDCVSESLVNINTNLNNLTRRLKEANNYANLDIMIVSDHGMADAKSKPFVDLDNYVDIESVQSLRDAAPVNGFWLPPNSKFKLPTSSNDNVKFYEKKAIPEKWHFKHNHRIPDILAVAREGYSVRKNPEANAWPQKGYHGYDNNLLSMRPIFFATGPHFKRNHVSGDVFEVVNYYSLACHILGIKEAPNNGSLVHVKDYLSSYRDKVNFAPTGFLVM
ncbi:Ectonucleotide pyrophosphatase/phosphodiesterase family member 5 [Halotydeus destructor]|nr:Ectonucleotide pyrophosphatase/phosphodiesterase family member 5 [Halotydeus destructor]